MSFKVHRSFSQQCNIYPVALPETLEQAFLQIRVKLLPQKFRVDLRTDHDKNFPFHLQNLEDDEEFQQALKTSHGQRPGVVSNISVCTLQTCQATGNGNLGIVMLRTGDLTTQIKAKSILPLYSFSGFVTIFFLALP